MNHAQPVQDGGRTARPPGKPHVAFVVNSLTPYRVQSHMRFKNEVPEYGVSTYVTWDMTKNPWIYKDPPDIGVQLFDGAAAEQDIGTVRYFRHDWATGGKIIKRLEADPPACVVVCGYGYPAMFRVIRWCVRRRKPFMVWSDSNAHSDLTSGSKRLLKNILVPWVVRGANAMLICGSNGKRYFSRYGCPPEKMFAFPVEPDYDELERVGTALMRETAEKYALHPGRRRLCVCARLVPVKCVDQAIDAFVAIADKRPELDLVIVGGGPFRSLLEARVPRRFRERVIFTGFVDQQARVSALYRLCDVFVHPANWEPWGVVLLEAAAAGLAMVTTHVVGAAPELCKHGVNGFVITANDRPSLERVLFDITEPARLEQFKKASKEVSAAFRRDFDPITGMRAALRAIGLLPVQ